MPSKCVLILLDGLGDRSYEELMHQTPLQAARTPVLDHLASVGCSGLYHAAGLGQALPSENAHFSMFGFDPADFPGRGVLEALGAGIALGERDVAVLAHFAALREEGGHLILEDGTPAVSDEEAGTLIADVGQYDVGQTHLRFHQTGGLFGVLVLRGDVSPHVTDTDPVRKGRVLVEPLPWQDYEGDSAAAATCRALKAYLLWVYARLRGHSLNSARRRNGLLEINGLVTQRAGRLKKITPFTQQYGLSGVSIASGPVYWGLCRYVGMDYRKVKDSKRPGEDLAARLEMAKELLRHYDFVHVHTKAPDEAAHVGNPLRKKAVIEALDTGIGQAIAPLLNDPEVLLIVTSDHSTPSAGPLIHSGEPVPLTFCGRGVRRDALTRFDEISAAAGALGGVRAKELMYLILNHLERAKLCGLMDTPCDQPFWPGYYQPFTVR